MNTQTIVKNESAVSTATGFNAESIKKYSLELTQVNNYLDCIKKSEDKQKAIAVLNNNPIYAHQKIAEYAI